MQPSSKPIINQPVQNPTPHLSGPPNPQHLSNHHMHQLPMNNLPVNPQQFQQIPRPRPQNQNRSFQSRTNPQVQNYVMYDQLHQLQQYPQYPAVYQAYPGNMVVSSKATSI